jgi:nitrite reductase (NADH) large subunit
MTAGPGASVRTVVVAGYGMVGHRFLAAMAERGQLGADGPWRAVVVGEEPRAAYDRVALSSYVEGLGADDLSLVAPGFHDTPGLVVHLGDRVAAADTAARTVTTAQGRVVAYDALVLATGSVPFVPPIPGTDAPGVFVYRTIDDLEAIRVWAAGCRTGVVVGGGLLGLEAANALRLLGLQATVVEFAPRLMPVQLDDGAAAVLQERIEALGIVVHTGCAATAGTRHSPPTWWCSPPASGPATTWPGPWAWRWASGVGWWSTTR